MKFRPHRGGFEESMQESIEINSLDHLVEHLNFIYQYCSTKVEKEKLESKFCILDERNNWNTFILTQGEYVLGYTNEPLYNLN